MKLFFGLILSLAIINIGLAKEPFQINGSLSKTAISSNVAVYNLSNAKMHTHDCEWAERCTKNCIYLDKEKLDNIFYIPCAVCGGDILDIPNE